MPGLPRTRASSLTLILKSLKDLKGLQGSWLLLGCPTLHFRARAYRVHLQMKEKRNSKGTGIDLLSTAADNLFQLDLTARQDQSSPFWPHVTQLNCFPNTLFSSSFFLFCTLLMLTDKLTVTYWALEPHQQWFAAGTCTAPTFNVRSFTGNRPVWRTAHNGLESVTEGPKPLPMERGVKCGF